MKAAAYTGNGITTIELTPAPPPPGMIAIRVAFVGLCGTDLHIAAGDMDARVATPHIFGHEMSGTVNALGEGATGPTVGTAVTVMPLVEDGTCPACVAGFGHICQHLEFLGVDSAGALQEIWTVPARTVIEIPAELALRDAALIEPVAVACHDVRRSALVEGDAVVVIGGGPIGLLIAAVARANGARVTVIEPDERRRQRAVDLGFEVLDPSRDDVTADVEASTGEAGADVVFEVSGSSAGALSAPRLARVRGTVVVVAIHPEPRPIDLHRVFWRELTLLGARVYEREDFDQAIRHLTDGVIPADVLITDVVRLDQTGDAMRRLAAADAMKILVEVGGSVGAGDRA